MKTKDIQDIDKWVFDMGISGMTGNQRKMAEALINLPEMELIGEFDHIFKSIRQWKRNAPAKKGNTDSQQAN